MSPGVSSGCRLTGAIHLRSSTTDLGSCALLGGDATARGRRREVLSESRMRKIAAAAYNREVGLHLLARRRLEAHHRFGLARLLRRQPRLELADAAVIAALADLAQ